jgi:hypothetical protein
MSIARRQAPAHYFHSGQGDWAAGSRRMGGKAGMTAKKRKEIAKKAADRRWEK